MISPLLPENKSPYLRYRQPEFDVFGPTQEISFRDRGFILLNLAAEYAHIEIVQFLLNNQPFYANIHERANGYYTTIQSAAESWAMTRHEPFYPQDWVDRKEAIMNLLLDWGARASDSDFPLAEEKTSATVLTLAAKWAGPGLIKRLIQGGADVHARGYIDDVTAIFIACVYGNFNAIEILLDYRGNEIDAVDFEAGRCAKEGIASKKSQF
ncbi:ankyrin [Fusarium mundagurra]|uniref:Ankyrin n=1 Tax=Fusarium mundagurra TaxID=1567541 RepID=A0A8H5XPP2_9HYPO|nr:ankyrin [Fusarium mundagurra]